MRANPAPKLTEGNLNKSIWVLAVPMMLEMAMESVFAVADVFFVGKISTDAVATVGFSEALLWVVYSVGYGFSIGATALVSRRVGEKKPKEASVAAAQSGWLGVLVSVPLTLVGVLYAEQLLMAMGASAQIASTGRIYLTITFVSTPIIMLLFINNAVFRAAGDPKMAMWALWLANGMNIVLDPLLIFGVGPFPEMGLEGAALASLIGRGCGVVFQVVVLARGLGVIRIGLAHLRFRVAVLTKLFRLSLGATAQQFVETASWIFLVRIIASFGPDAVAGYTVAMRILAFAFLPAWGLSNAAATLVGQNLGAKRPDRAEAAVWRTGGWSSGALFLVMLLFVPLAEPLIRLFVEAPLVVAEGEQCLRIVSYGYVAFAMGMVTLQSFNGAGDTTTPLWISVLSLWGVKLPLAYVLSHHLGMGSAGVYTAVTVSYCILAVVGAALFRRGRWKQRAL